MTQTRETAADYQRRMQQNFLDDTAVRLRREALLKELTGLGRYDFHTWDRRATLTGAQAVKIKSLKTQMTQMKRGYEKKIAKLLKQIAVLEATHVGG